MYEHRYDVPALNLDLIVMNYARLTNKDAIRRYNQLGLKVVVLDTESGLLAKSGPRSPDGWANYIRVNGFGEFLSGYFFWGRELYEGFLRSSGISRDKLFLTGNPRYDVPHAKWASLLPAPVSKNFILINSNFAGANPKYSGSTEFESKMAKEAGLDPQVVTELIKDQARIQSRFLKETIRLVSSNPGSQFIFRPHPFEDEGVYKKAFESLSNVTVESKGEIFEVLQATKFLIHVNCTTAIDALFANVPAYSIEYINSNFMRSYAPLPSEVSTEIKSFDELDGLLRNSTSHELAANLRSERLAKVQDQFGVFDGNSGERVAEVLIELLNNPAHLKNFSLPRHEPDRTPERLAQRLLALSIYLFGSNFISKLRATIKPLRKSKELNIKLVRSLCNSLSDSGERVSVENATRSPLSVKTSSILIKKF